MSFKICDEEGIRYDIAYYHRATNEEKNLICIHEFNEPYYMINESSKKIIDRTSRLVNIYIKTKNKKDKEALWETYDRFTKLYCDRLKYRTVDWGD
jgi:hypothetical protein